MKVAIADYGMCNLGSVRRAFEECGAEVLVTRDPKCLREASKIVLPGVGNFSLAMKNLIKDGWVESLREEILEKKVPTLGICLGMQLLGSMSEESGPSDGLNFIGGNIVRIKAEDPAFKVPHIGWNNVEVVKDDPLFKDVPSGTNFYFVHSYHFIPHKKEHLCASVDYSAKLAAAVSAEHIYGVQFHPEKSGEAGFQIIKNFLEI